MQDIGTSHLGEPATAQAACRAAPCYRILVVEDDSELSVLYGSVLTRLGCLVDVAQDGAAGWEELQTKGYDLLITEQEMPNLTGVELVKMLRAARMALPVVMAARRLPLEELAKDPSLQIAATLAKPFLADAFLNTVESVLHMTESDHRQTLPSPGRPSQPSSPDLWLR